MKRIIAAVVFAAFAAPAAAIEHGGPWEVNETRAPWDQKQRERKAPDSTEQISPAPEVR
jgi:hypothetical protein